MPAGVPRDRGAGAGTPLDLVLCATSLVLRKAANLGLLTGEPSMTVSRGFVAFLQETPAESPDSNFAGLAAGEQDAEVTVRQAAAPCPQPGSPVGVSWEWLWQRSLGKPSRTNGKDHVGVWVEGGWPAPRIAIVEPSWLLT